MFSAAQSLTHSCATSSIPHFCLLSHSTLFPPQRTWSSALSCRTEGSSIFPSLLDLIQLFDVNIQGIVCSLMLPNLTSRVHLWPSFLQLSHWFLLKEGTTKIFWISTAPKNSRPSLNTQNISGMSGEQFQLFALQYMAAQLRKRLEHMVPITSVLLQPIFSFSDTIYLRCLAAQLAPPLLPRNTTTCRCYLYAGQIISATIFSRQARPRVPSQR